MMNLYSMNRLLHFHNSLLITLIFVLILRLLLFYIFLHFGIINKHPIVPIMKYTKLMYLSALGTLSATSLGNKCFSSCF